MYEQEETEEVFVSKTTDDQISRYDWRDLSEEDKNKYLRKEKGTGVLEIKDGPVLLEQIKNDLELADLALYLNRK